MIRYRRGPEPAALARARRWRIARLMLDWLEWEDAGGDPDDHAAVLAFVAARGAAFDAGYDDEAGTIRDALRSAGALKCVWCEADIQPSEPLEHHRPRRRHVAGRADTPWDPATHHCGYWWLTWTWDNLVPVCVNCNLAKGTRFPLDAAGRRCRPFDPPDDDTERPLMLDPARDDLAARVRYALPPDGSALAPPRRLRATEPQPMESRFLPTAARGDARAEETIGILGLRTGRLDKNWEKHLSPIRRFDVLPLRRAIERGEPPDVLRASWARLVQRHVRDPEANRRALSRAYLDHAFPEPERRALGFAALPTLEDPGPAEPTPPLFASSPLWVRFGMRLALAVEACGSGQTADLERAHRLFTEAGEPLEALADALGMDPARLRERLGGLL